MGSEVKPRRVALGQRLRFEVFKRDEFTCVYCGTHPPGVVLHVDHVVPVVAGGRTHMDNLVTACNQCNQGKSSIPLDVVPEAVVARAARVAEQEAQLLGYQRLLEDRRERENAEAWRVLEVLGWSDSAPASTFASALQFVRKLGMHGTLECADVAVARTDFSGKTRERRFAYFCGICWNKIKGR